MPIVVRKDRNNDNWISCQFFCTVPKNFMRWTQTNPKICFFLEPLPHQCCRNPVTALWPSLSASDSGVNPHRSVGSGETPQASRRNRTHSRWPPAAARWRGVRPSKSEMPMLWPRNMCLFRGKKGAIIYCQIGGIFVWSSGGAAVAKWAKTVLFRTSEVMRAAFESFLAFA